MDETAFSGRSSASVAGVQMRNVLSLESTPEKQKSF